MVVGITTSEVEKLGKRQIRATRDICGTNVLWQFCSVLVRGFVLPGREQRSSSGWVNVHQARSHLAALFFHFSPELLSVILLPLNCF